MSFPADTDRGGAARSSVMEPPAHNQSPHLAARLALVVLASTLLASAPAGGSAPRTTAFDTIPDELVPLTQDMATRDPLATEARCRSFLAALYHRHRALCSNPAWAPDDPATGPLEWVPDAFFTLPPASPGVRAAHAAAGDLTRAYLDAFGPGSQIDALPYDPLYRNDKSICTGILGLPHD